MRDAYTWEGTVVPKIALVWEAVSHKSKFAFLYVLLDWVEKFFFRDLLLGVGPSRNFYNHVEDGLLLIGIQWDIVER